MDMEEKRPLISAGEHSRSYTDEQSSVENVLHLSDLHSEVLSANNKPSPSSNVDAYKARLTYTWNEIDVFVVAKPPKSRILSRSPQQQPTRKHILKSVFGVAYPGELLAILGSSGSGKTTLLNTLTFNNPSSVVVNGMRCVNGIPVNSNTLTSQSAYVQQDDLFIGSLTVKEHLIFQALVRMDRCIPYGKRLERVRDVISELGLTKCQDTAIGIPGRIKGISGGEIKRLSFAAEVLTNPSFMFCDEPTSGLDSFMALNVMQVLKGLAQKGKTVVCTIHQPSSDLYAMFDKLLLLAEGRVAFLGTPAEASTFFTSLNAPCPRNYNPADYYIQLLAIVPGREESCRQAINMICDQYHKSKFGITVSKESTAYSKADLGYNEMWLHEEIIRNPYKASWCAQFRAVLWRSWLSVMKEPLLVKVRLIQTVIVSLLIAAIYYGQELNQNGVMNINGVIFIFLTSMTFQNVFGVINVFCMELPVFLREHRNGMYRTDVYFICKTLAEMPLFIALPVVFVSISYYLIGLNPEEPRFPIAVAIITLVANVAISFGYLISCVSSSITMALSLGPTVVIPFLLFGGFFLNIASIPPYIRWLSYLSWFKYGNEALLINQWHDINNITCTTEDPTCYGTGRVVIEVYNFSEDNFLWDIVALVCLIIGFRFVAFLGLLSKTYRSE